MPIDFFKPWTPYICLRPGVMSGRATINGHRLPVEQIASMWASGNWCVDAMVDGWPDILDHDSVVVCCWYMAKHGTQKWKRPWRDWLAKYDGRLWQGKDKTPLPPRFLMGETGTEAVLEEEQERIYAREADGFFDLDYVAEWEGA